MDRGQTIMRSAECPLRSPGPRARPRSEEPAGDGVDCRTITGQGTITGHLSRLGGPLACGPCVGGDRCQAASAGSSLLGSVDGEFTRFTRCASHGSGVWELPALKHEPAAWVRHMPAPDTTRHTRPSGIPRRHAAAGSCRKLMPTTAGAPRTTRHLPFASGPFRREYECHRRLRFTSPVPSWLIRPALRGQTTRPVRW